MREQHTGTHHIRKAYDVGWCFAFTSTKMGHGAERHASYMLCASNLLLVKVILPTIPKEGTWCKRGVTGECVSHMPKMVASEGSPSENTFLGYENTFDNLISKEVR